MSNALVAPHFQNPEAAREWLEGQRWPDGPICSHCGTFNHAYKTAKPGWYRCAAKECRKDFTVTTGTVMERSKIALNKWLMAFYLMASSKKGISAHQLHRTLGVDYKSAWFLCHRIREAMRDGGLSTGFTGPLGGAGKVVEADETYFGQQDNPQPSKARRGRPYTKGGKSGPSGKRMVVALVERGGRVRSFNPATTDGGVVADIVRENIARESKLYTDESSFYRSVGEEFAEHETVKHSADEYVRVNFTWGSEGPKTEKIHTNTIENYFSVFKRGMRGIYQHCGEKHLHRYLAEYDFRYNYRVGLGYSDIDRTKAAIQGVVGKRLLYRQPH
jgi:transposase-like protein